MKKTSSIFRKNKLLYTFLIIVALAGLGGAGYMYNENKKLKNDVKAVQSTKEKTPDEINKELVEKVSNLAILPSTEQPTILTVDDKSKLQNQEFFKSAENGDKVLVYTQSKKAFIYRESINKIVDIGPVSIADNQTKTEGTTTNQNPSTPTTTTETPSIP